MTVEIGGVNGRLAMPALLNSLQGCLEKEEEEDGSQTVSLAHSACVRKLGCCATCVNFEGELVVKVDDKANEGVRDSKFAQYGPQGRVLYRVESFFKINEERKRGEVCGVPVSQRHLEREDCICLEPAPS